MKPRALSPKELAQFRDLDRRLMLAFVNKDELTLSALLDPEYAGVNVDGSALDGAEFLAELRAKTPLPFDAFPATQAGSVRRFGDTVLITADLTFTEGALAATLRHLGVWVKRGRDWRFAHWQVTAVTPEGLARERQVRALMGRAPRSR